MLNNMRRGSGFIRLSALVLCYGAVALFAPRLDARLGCQSILTIAAFLSFTALVFVLIAHWDVARICGLCWPSAQHVRAAVGYAPVLVVPLCNLLVAHDISDISIDQLIGAVICAPALEELCFRGYLLGAARKSGYGAIISVVATSLVFATLHLANAGQSDAFYTGAQLATAFFYGSALGFMRLETNSVLPCIAIHLLVNATAAGAIGYSYESLCTIVFAAVISGAWAFVWFRAHHTS